MFDWLATGLLFFWFFQSDILRHDIKSDCLRTNKNRFYVVCNVLIGSGVGRRALQLPVFFYHWMEVELTEDSNIHGAVGNSAPLDDMDYYRKGGGWKVSDLWNLHNDDINPANSCSSRATSVHSESLRRAMTTYASESYSDHFQ
jgi:hypothetical protein